MGHRIYQNKFYGWEAPGWHALGHTSMEPRTAEEAWNTIGPYPVRLRPVMVDLNGVPTDIGYDVVVREATPESPAEQVFGSPVARGWQLYTPEGAVQSWDRCVLGPDGRPAPVETMAALEDGARLFITTRLPSFDVRGREVRNYMILDNPLTPGESVKVFISPIRVECWNLLMASIANAIVMKRITHVGTADIQTYMEVFLRTLYSNAIATHEVMKEAFNVLANKRVNEVQMQWISEKVYPMPKRPNTETRSKKPMEEIMAAYEQQRERTEQARGAIVGYFNGAGIGFDSPDVKGTAYGAFNAVSQYETYKKGASQQKAVLSMVSGDRAIRIRKAYKLAVEL